MVSAVDASKNRWGKDVVVLYDDDGFSVILGTYGDNKCLGIRWNGGGSSHGFPLLRNGDEGWFVVPDFLVGAILYQLLDEPMADAVAVTNAIKGRIAK